MHKYAFIISCHNYSSKLTWHSWNSSSCKTGNYLVYIVNTMAADDLATQGTGVSTTMILIWLNRDNSLPPRYGSILMPRTVVCHPNGILEFVFGSNDPIFSERFLLAGLWVIWHCQFAFLQYRHSRGFIPLETRKARMCPPLKTKILLRVSPKIQEKLFYWKGHWTIIHHFRWP